MKKIKKITAVFMALLMVVTSIPMTVFAQSRDTSSIDAYLDKDNLTVVLDELLTAIGDRKEELLPTVLNLAFMANPELVSQAEADGIDIATADTEALATSLINYHDAVLEEANLEESIKDYKGLISMVLNGVKIDLNSVDGMIGTLVGALDFLANKGKSFSGDAADFDTSMLKVGTGKKAHIMSSDNSSSVEILNGIIAFFAAEDNIEVFKKVVKGNVDFGSINGTLKAFVNFDAEAEINNFFGNLGYLVAEAVYNAVLAEKEYDEYGNATVSVPYAESEFASFTTDELFAAAFINLVTGEYPEKSEAAALTQMTFNEILIEYADFVINTYALEALNVYLKEALFDFADGTQFRVLAEFINPDYEFKENAFGFSEMSGSLITDNINNIVCTFVQTIVTPEVNEALGLVSGGNEHLNANLESILRFFMSEITESNGGKFNLGVSIYDEFLQEPTTTHFEIDFSGFTKSAIADKSLEDMLVAIFSMLYPYGFETLVPEEVTTLEQLCVYIIYNTVKLLENNASDFSVDSSLVFDEEGKVRSFTREESDNVLGTMGMDAVVYLLDEIVDLDLPPERVKELKAQGWTWEDFFEDIVDWGLSYIKGAPAVSDVLSIERGVKDGTAWYKLNVVLNEILPLSFVNGCGDETFTFDCYNAVIKTIAPALADGDFATAFGVFSANDESDNPFNKPIFSAIVEFADSLISAILSHDCGSIGTFEKTAEGNNAGFYKGTYCKNNGHYVDLTDTPIEKPEETTTEAPTEKPTEEPTTPVYSDGKPELRFEIPDNIEAGDTFTVVLAGENLEGLGSADLEFHYDADFLEFVSIKKGSESDFYLAEGNNLADTLITWSLMVKPGYEVSAFDIAEITFRALQPCSTRFAVTKNSWEGTREPANISADIIINEDSSTEHEPPADETTTAVPTTVPPTMKPTEKPTEAPTTDVVPDESVLLGDIDGDGYATSTDARTALRISAKLEKAPYEQLVIIDVDGNGKITAADSRNILRASALLDTIENGAPARTYLDAERDGNVWFDTKVAENYDGTITVSLSAKNAIGTCNGNLFVKYDPEVLEFESVVPNASGGFTPAAGNPENGIISFAFMFLEASVVDDIDFATITFNVLKSEETNIEYTVGTWNGTYVPNDGSFKLSVEEPTTTEPETEVPTTEPATGNEFEETPEDYPALYFDISESFVAGRTINVGIKGENLKGLISGDFYITYDPEVLEFVYVAPNASGGFTPAAGSPENGKVTFSFMFRDSATVDEVDFTVITFKVLKAEETTIEYTIGTWDGTPAPKDGSFKLGAEEPTTKEPETEVPTTEPTTVPTTENPTEPPVHEHDYVGVVATAPTCTDDGVKTFTCECGDSYEESIAATGHNGEWKVVTPAEIGVEGLKQFVCTVCDAILSEEKLPALAEPETVAPTTKEPETQVPTTEKPSEKPTEKPTEAPTQKPVSDKLEVKDDTVKVDNTAKVSTVNTKSSANDILKSVKNEKVSIVDKDGKAISGDTLVGTGAKIQIKDNSGKVINTYTVCVPTDVDGNGKTTAADARLALRGSAKLEKVEGVYAFASDMNGDGKITAADARKILRISAGLEKA